jgi:hypothetical protein
MALKLLLHAWNAGVDPNADATATSWRAIAKAEARKRGVE